MPGCVGSCFDVITATEIANKAQIQMWKKTKETPDKFDEPFSSWTLAIFHLTVPESNAASKSSLSGSVGPCPGVVLPRVDIIFD